MSPQSPKRQTQRLTALAVTSLSPLRHPASAWCLTSHNTYSRGNCARAYNNLRHFSNPPQSLPLENRYKTGRKPVPFFLLVSPLCYNSNPVLTQKNNSCLQCNSPNINKHRTTIRIRAIFILTVISREEKQHSHRPWRSPLILSHVASLAHSEWFICLFIFLFYSLFYIPTSLSPLSPLSALLFQQFSIWSKTRNVRRSTSTHSS